MRFVPGPDLPTGGRIVGLEGIREAYETGRGIFRTRATAAVEQLTPRRSGIVVTELPYSVGPEKVMARIKDLVQAKKLNGIADLKDLTDRHRGLHLVIEVRSGFNPEAVLAELYRLTPMEETFGINNVALVDGQPRVLGLRELLEIFVAHRLDVVRRRTEYRRRKRSERLHLVDGLLVALLNIDEVISVIRSSDNAAAARERLMTVFDLSEIQAQYILDTPLRRLTRYDRLELEREQDELRAEIASLTAILDSDEKLREVVGGELARGGEEVRHAAAHGAAGGRLGAAAVAAVPLEVADDPCAVLMSATGLVARVPLSSSDESERALLPPPADASRAAHDVVISAVRATARGTVGLVTSAGRLIKLNVLELPAMPPGAGAVSLAGGTPVSEFASFGRGETVVGLAAVDGGRPGGSVGGRAGPRDGGGRGQAGAARLPAEPGRVRADHAAGPATGWSARCSCPASRTSWCSSPPTRSCCGSRPPRSGRRAGRPAAWQACGFPRVPRSCGSARWTPPRRQARRRGRRGATPPPWWSP